MGDYERLCTTEHCLRYKKSRPWVGLKPGIASSVGQRSTHWATWVSSMSQGKGHCLLGIFMRKMATVSGVLQWYSVHEIMVNYEILNKVG